MKINKLVVLCDCGSPEHQIIITAEVDDDPAWSFVGFEFHLTTYQNVLKRGWVALKYLFGYRSKYGEWDDVTLKPDEAVRIAQFLLKFSEMVESTGKEKTPAVTGKGLSKKGRRPPIGANWK